MRYMKGDDYNALGGWPSADAPGRPVVGTLDCSFTGVPTLALAPTVPTFRLLPDQSVQVVIGKLFDETGLAATDLDELSEGTDYVFRAFASSAPSEEASPEGEAVWAVTTSRNLTDCTLTLGFWKKHPEDWTHVPSMGLGANEYSRVQLLAILNTPAKGNGLVSLAHQLIAAKLNELLGALPPPQVSAVVQQADAMIGARSIPPVGLGALRPSDVSRWVRALDAFNGGRVGPAHCPSTLDPVSTSPETWGRVKVRYR